MCRLLFIESIVSRVFNIVLLTQMCVSNTDLYMDDCNLSDPNNNALLLGTVTQWPFISIWLELLLRYFGWFPR